jgi:glucose-6-phosphate 1-epimerase
METIFRGTPALSLTSAGGATAVVALHGAQLLSFVPAGGREWLFLSERAAFAPGQAIRGGVPICFPQFASLGTLPKHGLVRTRPWRVEATGDDGGVAWARLDFDADEEVRRLWPHPCWPSLEVRLEDDRVALSLRVENPGEVPLSFTAALHGYFEVGDVEEAVVEGLRGVECRDAADGDSIDIERNAQLRIHGEFDRVYHAVPGPVTLRAGDRRLRLEADGFHDVVVWNPGAEKGDALPDMAPGGWRRMLCVEAGAVRAAVTVPAGGRWTGRQVLVAR